jgi:hypothetical protein
MQFTMTYRQKPVKTADQSNCNRFAADFHTPGSAFCGIGKDDGETRKARENS